MKHRTASRTWSVVAGLTAAALVLTACSTASSNSTDSKGKKPSEITALILSSAAYDPCSVKYAADFQKKTGIKVKLISEGFPTYHDKLLTTLSSDSDTYDVAMLAYQWTGEFAAPGFLNPLDKAVAQKGDELSGIIKTATDLYTYKDTQYAIPFSAQAETLFYRTDLFEKAGFEPPKTWDDYNKIVKFFTNNPDYPGVSGTSIRAATQHDGTNFDNRYYGLGGGQIGEPGSKLNVKLATKALQILSDNVAASPSGALSATFVETGAQMQAGSVAMIEAMPSTVLNLLKDNIPANKVYGKIGLATLPGGVGEAGGWGWVVPKTSSKVDAATDFATFMSSEQADHACYVDYGKSAVQQATYKAPDVTKAFYTKGIAAAVGKSLGKPNGATASKINTMLDETTSRFLSGQISSAKAAAEEMAATYADLVDK
jgi:multiple sugar transport system substrate-binding protein